MPDGTGWGKSYDGARHESSLTIFLLSSASATMWTYYTGLVGGP